MILVYPKAGPEKLFNASRVKFLVVGIYIHQWYTRYLYSLKFIKSKQIKSWKEEIQV